ncbi:MAG: hypothetical protein KAG61_13170 [Bacteriovoracaceae bacterium]|nr:hypothetical protein [Bacteriovoracaceae bacterium]
MSLGGRLSALKKKVDEVAKVIECESLVIGSDIYSLELYAQLKKKSDSVILVSPKDFAAENIRPFGPSTIRGRENIAIFQKLYPEASVSCDYGVSLFFKDQKWRKFGGRSKSEKLLDGEEFYTSPRTRINWNELFETSSRESINSIQEESLQLIPQAISFSDNTWNVKLSAGTDIRTTKLFWGERPDFFTDCFTESSKLPPALFEYAESTKSDGKYLVKLQLKEEFTDIQDTLFIPLSYTHDWGHYIGEIDSEDAKKIEFVASIDLDQSSEEEVTRRIKTLKRSLDKIFPGFKKNVSSEYFSLFENSASTVIADEKYNNAKESLSGLVFIGENAPIDSTYFATLENEEVKVSRLSHLCRALISLRQALVY